MPGYRVLLVGANTIKRYKGLLVGTAVSNTYPRVRRDLLAEERSKIPRAGSVRVALIWPGTYETGMSNLGFLWVYEQLNKQGVATCDRFFSQVGRVDFTDHAPLSLEQGLTLGEYDLIAISIAAEVQMVPLVRMLDAGGVPLKASERTSEHLPIIIGGALTRSNPGLVQGMANVLVWGDGEEAVARLVGLLEQGIPTPETMIEGMTGADGVVQAEETFDVWRPAIASNPVPLVSGLTAKHTTFSEMILAEVVRGCPRACGFCVCSRFSSPMRFAGWEQVVASLPEDELRYGFMGAGIGDYPDLVQLLSWVAEQGKTASVSSLRTDRVSLELAEALFSAGARSATLALDGASQRLRDEIHKGVNEAQFIHAVEHLKAAGLSALKLYAMVGLPGETEEDLIELAGLVARARRILPLTLAMSPFVPKQGTPLGKADFTLISSLTASLGYLKKHLPARQRASQVSPREAWVEYLLSHRGLGDLDRVIEVARGRASFRDWRKAFPEVPA
jgi:radical SAM superfamily enzyme YgiQ (UPF0313 family)